MFWKTTVILILMSIQLTLAQFWGQQKLCYEFCSQYKLDYTGPYQKGREGRALCYELCTNGGASLVGPYNNYQRDDRRDILVRYSCL